jgi:hypothetical protein
MGAKSKLVGLEFNGENTAPAVSMIVTWRIDLFPRIRGPFVALRLHIGFYGRVLISG